MPEEAQFDKLKQKPLVLISPLDWGWGHTTRCIPLIETLIGLNCSVLIACNHWQKDLLRPLFPTCSFLELPGYNIKYAGSGSLTRLKLLLQIPRILRTIQQENRWLAKLLKTTPINGIISDNRYGISHPGKPSVLITHQLRIQSGGGRLTDNLLQKLHYRLLARFRQVWIPDNPSQPGAAGILSHPPMMPSMTSRYIGCLSRMQKCDHQLDSGILILLSGPEPQRTILEKHLVHQLSHVNEQVVLVRGTFTAPGLTNLPGNVSVLNHCSGRELNTIICNARLVIARSGYTSIMDLLKLRKKSILIPTPGQSEQQYLGQHLMKNQWAITVSQKDFNLKTALEKSATYPYKMVDWDMEQYKPIIREWVRSIQ